jgi:cation-transporting P-type ATPase 13A2
MERHWRSYYSNCQRIPICWYTRDQDQGQRYLKHDHAGYSNSGANRSVCLYKENCFLITPFALGFNTTKGALIRSMLFPKPMGFKFYRDSMRFIAVLACIAGLGFLASAFQFIRLQVCQACLQNVNKLMFLQVPWGTIILRALDLITVVVPPALPATLSIGTSFAVGRLRKAGVYCISPSRVNVGGKVNVVCFDKTGTLTEDGLDVLGVRCLDRASDHFGDLISDVYDIPLGSGKTSFLHALATCHSLKFINGEVVGDPLDVKMFQFTDWILEEGRVGTGAPRRSEGRSTGERPIALVQTVVRPPGVGGFRLEDALKSGSKVCLRRETEL